MKGLASGVILLGSYDHCAHHLVLFCFPSLLNSTHTSHFTLYKHRLHAHPPADMMMQALLSLLLQLSLFSLVSAAPVSVSSSNVGGGVGGGVVGFVVLILDIIAWGMFIPSI